MRRLHIPYFRYVIPALLLLATMINYADHLMLYVVTPVLRAEFGITVQEYSHVVACFMAAYAVMYAAGGPIADRLDTRQ